MRIFTLAAFVIFTIFCTIVAVSNKDIVTFTLRPLPFTWDLPLYFLLFFGIFIGLGAGALVVMGKSFKHARHSRQQAKIIRAQDIQIKDLTPLKPAEENPTNDTVKQDITSD